MEGYFTYDLYSFFYVQFFPCVNTTEKHNCKPIEEIDFYLKSTFVSFLMENIELTPKNYYSPVKAKNEDIFTTVNKNLNREVHAYFQIVKIETDLDIFGFDEFENFKTEVFLKYDEMVIMDQMIESDIYKTGESFCDFTLKLSELVRTKRRTYTKLITILGEIGGFVEIFYTLFRVLSSFCLAIVSNRYIHKKAQDSVNCYLSCTFEALGLPIFVRYKQHRGLRRKKHIVHPKRGDYIPNADIYCCIVLNKDFWSFLSFKGAKTSVNKRLSVCTHFFTLLSSANQFNVMDGTVFFLNWANGSLTFFQFGRRLRDNSSVATDKSILRRYQLFPNGHPSLDLYVEWPHRTSPLHVFQQ